jgi:hypothetical protein
MNEDSVPERDRVKEPATEKGELFMVGRVDRTGRRIVFVNEPAEAPFPGPWELHAVFTI